MSTYKNTYNEKAVGQIVPIVIVVFLIVLYMMSAQGDRNYAASILIGAAAITMVFWARILKKFILSQQSKFVAREPETKNWMYDLIKDEGGFVFVAEVPGPVEKITVRLVDGILYVRGSGSFAREVPITGADRMELSDFKYRNGVLTLRIS